MWGKKKNQTVIWPLYIPTTQIPTFHIRQEKSRTWEDKMYLYPIPTGELQRKSAIVTTESGMVNVVTTDLQAVI